METRTDEKLPPKGYHSVSFYKDRYGLSLQKIKELVRVFDPDSKDCLKNVNGLSSAYEAYLLSDMDNSMRSIKAEMRKVTPSLYESTYLTGRFRCNRM